MGPKNKKLFIGDTFFLLLFSILALPFAQACPPEGYSRFVDIGASADPITKFIKQVFSTTNFGQYYGRDQETQLKALVHNIYRQVESLPQEDIARRISRSIEEMNRREGYLRGLDPQTPVHSLDELIRNFVNGPNKGNYFGHVWANTLSAPASILGLLEINPLRGHLDSDDIANLVRTAVESAIWERTRRLISSGQWHVIYDPEVLSAYTNSIRNADFVQNNNLAQKKQRLFPK